MTRSLPIALNADQQRDLPARLASILADLNAATDADKALSCISSVLQEAFGYRRGEITSVGEVLCVPVDHGLGTRDFVIAWGGHEATPMPPKLPEALTTSWSQEGIARGVVICVGKISTLSWNGERLAIQETWPDSFAPDDVATMMHQLGDKLGRKAFFRANVPVGDTARSELRIDLWRGQALFIVGANGTGKTALLRHTAASYGSWRAPWESALPAWAPQQHVR